METLFFYKKRLGIMGMMGIKGVGGTVDLIVVFEYIKIKNKGVKQMARPKSFLKKPWVKPVLIGVVGFIVGDALDLSDRFPIIRKVTDPIKSMMGGISNAS